MRIILVDSDLAELGELASELRGRGLDVLVADTLEAAEKTGQRGTLRRLAGGGRLQSEWGPKKAHPMLPLGTAGGQCSFGTWHARSHT